MEKKLNNLLSSFIYSCLVISIILFFGLLFFYIIDLITSHLYDYINYFTVPLMFYLFCLLTFIISIIKGFKIMKNFAYDKTTCENILSIFLIYTYGTIVYNIFNIVLLCLKMESVFIYIYIAFGIFSLIVSILIFFLYRYVKKIVNGGTYENK